jgi:hypothetical protein
MLQGGDPNDLRAVCHGNHEGVALAVSADVLGAKGTWKAGGRVRWRRGGRGYWTCSWSQIVPNGLLW